MVTMSKSACGFLEVQPFLYTEHVRLVSRPRIISSPGNCVCETESLDMIEKKCKERKNNECRDADELRHLAHLKERMNKLGKTVTGEEQLQQEERWIE